MTRSRREFIRDLGVGAASLPFLLNLPSLAFANQAKRKQRLVILFSPNGVIPPAFWPDEIGAKFTLKESMTPLEPFRDRTLFLRGVSDRIRGDGDGHMRGMGCLLTGIELFPGNIQGGSDTPAGWAKGHLHRPGDQEPSAEPTPPRARGSARWSSASWCPTAPTPGRAWSTPDPTSRSRRSTTPTRCSASSTATSRTGKR